MNLSKRKPECNHILEQQIQINLEVKSKIAQSLS